MICGKQKGFLFNETVWACFAVLCLIVILVGAIYA